VWKKRQNSTENDTSIGDGHFAIFKQLLYVFNNNKIVYNNSIWRLHCRGPWGPEYIFFISYWCVLMLKQSTSAFIILISTHRQHHNTQPLSAISSWQSGQLTTQLNSTLLYNNNQHYLHYQPSLLHWLASMCWMSHHKQTVLRIPRLLSGWSLLLGGL